MSAPLADAVRGAVDELAEAVREAWPVRDGGARVYPDPEQLGRVDPPALLFGPPSFRWGRLGGVPDEMTLRVALVVAANDRASGRLLVLLPQAVAAIETAPGAVVRSAAPGSVSVDAGELPAYLIDVEMGL